MKQRTVLTKTAEKDGAKSSSAHVTLESVGSMDSDIFSEDSRLQLSSSKKGK